MTTNLQPEIEKIIAETAQVTASKIYAKLKAEQVKEQETVFDKRLYNTKLLMEHYRVFKEHVANAVFELTRLDEVELTAIEIMDSMWQTSGPGRGEIAIESIQRSTIRTQIVLEHIEEMLGIYEAMCSRSMKPEAERRWDVINTIYIKPIPEGKTKTDLYEELAEKHFTSTRQIQRDVNDALERITALMFGIDGIQRMASKKR